MAKNVLALSGRIFDGKDFLEKATVLVDGSGLISEVGVDTGPDHGLKSISDSKYTILPGLMDVHMHFFGSRKEDIAEWNVIPAELASIRSVTDMRNILFAGFTTVRDLGSKTGVFLAQAEYEGDIIGPHVISAGHSLAQTGGDDDFRGLPLEMAQTLSYSYYCDGPWECISAVRKVIREGGDAIKLYASGGFAAGGKPLPNLTVEEIRAIVDEGHRAGVKVTAHAYGEEALNNVIDAGVDSIDHGIGLTEDIAERIRKAGIYYVPTMSVYKAGKIDPNHIGLLTLIRGRSKANREEIVRKHVTKEIEIARDVSLKMATGTDYVGAENSVHGNNADELVYMSEYLGPLETLRAATSRAAECVGLSNSGTLKPGNYADLVVVEGNPGKNIEDVRKNRVRFVLHNGRLYDCQNGTEIHLK